MSKTSFFAELKRRNVIRVAIAYVAVSWLVLQAGALIFQMLELPGSALKGVFAVLAIGFIPTLVFSWVYELTPEGLKRESEVETHESITHLTGRKLDYLVIGVLCAVVALLLVDKFVLTPRQVARAAASAAVSESAPAPQASIAVLPFVNMSSDKEQDFFSDGISEELLNLLAKVPQLQVTARTSSFAFKGKEIGIAEIAKTLHVAHVLEGSVRKSGNEVRITAQLINAATDTHLWSQTYDRKLDDIFAIQDEIATDVVKQLKVTLLGAAPTARTTDPQAYALFLQARQLGHQRTVDALKQAEAFLRQALAIDPRYAPAWSELARTFFNEAGIGTLSNDEGLRQAREAAEKALAIDPNYALAHALLGRVAASKDDMTGAARYLERALALDPSDLDVLSESAVLLLSVGRLQQAIAVNEYVVARDPVNVRTLFNLGLSYRFAARYDDAIARFHTALSLNPSRGSAHYQLGTALLFKGDAAGALAEVEQETSEVWKLMGLPMAYHALGRQSDTDAALATMIAKEEKDGAYNIAYIYAFLGDADQTFEWLNKAVQYADPGLSEIVAQNLFDKVHKDPRWLPFLRRIGKAPEQLAKVEFKVTLPKAVEPAP